MRRPGRGAALLACAAGGGLLLLASHHAWGVPSTAVPGGTAAAAATRPTGASLAPLTVGVGLLGLAGVAGLLATRGTGRRVVGAVLAVAGLAAGVVTVVQAHRVAGAVVTVTTSLSVTLQATAWPWLALVGALLVGGAGGLAAWDGARWGRLSTRYDAVGATPAAGDLWAALDRGEDPTAPAPPPGPVDAAPPGEPG